MRRGASTASCAGAPAGRATRARASFSSPWETSAIGQAQKRVELQNFQARKKLLEYDDVMNQQREVIYSLRLFALEGGEELKAEAQSMVDAAMERLVDVVIAEQDDPFQWDWDLITSELLQKFLL